MRWQVVVSALTALMLVFGVPIFGPASPASPVAQADQTTVTFEDFTLGSPNGQQGWSKTGPFDHAIADVSSTPFTGDLGSKALRVSNSVVSGSFGDQTFSVSLANETGETSAQNGGQSGGVRSAYYETEFDFASADAAEQAAMGVSISPDRGDGARMSWVRIEDSAGGLNVLFNDFQHDLTPNPANNFVQTTIATGLSRTEVHTIKITMIFVDGIANDIVRVFVNGALVHTGDSWEDYFRDAEGNPTRTVDSLLFRTSGTASPASAGKGLFFDNIKQTSGLTSVFVRTDGDDATCDGTADAAATGSGICAVQTIARGAQLAAALGATVNVGPGTYSEAAITLPAKNTFTLKGTQAGSRPVISNGLILSAVSDLRLENLIVEGANDSGGAETSVVSGSGITNFTMKNVKIDGENVALRHGITGTYNGNISITESQFEDIPHWSAFDTRSGSGGATQGSTIGTAVFNDNTMTNVKGHINFRSTITGAPAAVIQVMNNTITGTGTATTSFGGIIKIFYAASATISGNTFKDVGTSGFNPGGEAPYGAAVMPRQVTSLTIENNLFEDNNQAIAIEPRNTTSGGFADGVLSQGTISNNTFINNKFAVYIPATLHPSSNIAGLTVTNNSFTTNVVGGEGVHNGFTTGSLPATSNWWSSTSGPSHASNVSPNGVVVTNNVTFSPFLTRGTDTSPSIGFQPEVIGPITTAFVRTDGSSTECDGSADAAFTAGALGACAVATVQKGVDNVQAGGTVNVGAGTYLGAAGSVNTAKSVNIQGASRATTILDGFVSGSKTNTHGIQFTGGVNGASVKNLTVRRYNQHGIFAGGFASGGAGTSNFTVDNVESSDNGTSPSASRGIVVWDDVKTNITITNSIANNNALVGIDLQDGTVANLILTGNTATGNGDSGIGVQGPKTAMNVSGNTVTNNGRYGIEIKNPDGPTSGISPLVVDGNTVSRTVPATDVRDHAGIVVMRRDPLAPNVDQPAGVIVQNNVVSGFRANAPGTTGEGFCIVVEGTNIVVRNNNVDDCDVGIQMQKGNTANVQSTQGFDRGSAADFTGIVELNSIAITNATGLRGVGLTAATNATRNWWSSATGPTTASNPGGTGAPVVGANVQFSPWLADGTDTSGSIGFQPNLTPLGSIPTQGINVAPSAGLVTTENGGTAQFSIVLASQPTGDVTVGLTSSNTNEGTVSPSSMTFTPANWNVPQVATVTGVSAGAPNGNVAYTIITAPATSSDPFFNGVDPTDVSVTNNAATNPTVSIANASVIEGNGTTTPMAFNVTLSAAHTRTVSVNFASANGTATAPTDYTQVSGTLTFAPGETTKPINVLVTADTLVEPDETFTVTLSSPVEASLAQAQATGTITTDDVTSPLIGPCDPRPNISVTTQSVGGRRMQVTVKADTAQPNGANLLTSITFGTPRNATIQMIGQSNIGTSQIAFPSSTTQTVFIVQQTNPNEAFHVPFFINDTCGQVEKFVGGGKDALAN